ncbi:MAG: hypothetical protein RJA99_1757 [Pseudomonadota bacterium]|jgi:hypothetical protein
MGRRPPLAIAIALVLASAGPACGIGVACAADDATMRRPAPTQGEAMARACARLPRVTVHASSAQDAETACEGAGRALDFLARAGLDGPSETTIEIVPELPGDLAGRAFGCYVPETRRILLVDFDAFRAAGGWFGMPPSRELYRAVASHEVAHAVAGGHAAPRRLPAAAHEYVAYVTLFATMDPPLRAAILDRFPGSGFATVGQISDLNHVVAPNRFGVDAWRHYLKARDRDAWLRRVIAGEVVPEGAPDPDASSR